MSDSTPSPAIVQNLELLIETLERALASARQVHGNFKTVVELVMMGSPSTNGHAARPPEFAGPDVNTQVQTLANALKLDAKRRGKGKKKLGRPAGKKLQPATDDPPAEEAYVSETMKKRLESKRILSLITKPMNREALIENGVIPDLSKIQAVSALARHGYLKKKGDTWHPTGKDFSLTK